MVKEKETEYTKYEQARLIGARAFQLAVNAQPTVKVTPSEEPMDVATKEYYEHKIPLDIIRKKKE
jgi:DNA-directed RNA polymerase subunit K/omega